MILLPTTTSLLSLVTGGTESVEVHVSWIDALGEAVSVDGANTQVASATTTPICSGPPTNTIRDVEFASIYNADGANPVAITVTSYDGTTTSTLVETFDLPAGDTLFYEDELGWYRVSNGAEVFAQP